MARWGVPSSNLRFGIAETPLPNPADWREFRGWRLLPARGLRSRGLNGGGGSLGRTRLSRQFPDLQRKYREVLRNLRGLAEPEASFPSFPAAIPTNFLRSRTGNYFLRAGNQWEFDVDSEPRHKSEFIQPLAPHGRKPTDLWRISSETNGRIRFGFRTA